MARIEIELTDQELADLRQMPPYTGPGWHVPILNRICQALPAAPVQLTIELPAGLALSSLFDHQIYSGNYGNGKRITMAEAAALTAVVSALRLREQGGD